MYVLFPPRARCGRNVSSAPSRHSHFTNARPSVNKWGAGRAVPHVVENFDPLIQRQRAQGFGRPRVLAGEHGTMRVML